jgi:hypothetical protein
MKVWLIIYLLGVLFSIYTFFKRFLLHQETITLMEILSTFVWSFFSWGMVFVLYIDEVVVFTDKVGARLDKIGSTVIWKKGKK